MSYPSQTDNKPNVLVLSSSMLTDRMLVHTSFLDRLRPHAQTTIWATSAANPLAQPIWQSVPACVEAFPAVREYKEFPYNALRRLDEFAWDFRLRPATRLSMIRLIKNQSQKGRAKAMKVPAWFVSRLGLHERFEDRLERLLLLYDRSPEARARMAMDRPDMVLTTNPFWFAEPAAVAAAKNLGIPTMALIPSWDNVTTKNRMVFKYDAFLVWSEQTKRELHEFYPYTRDVPVYTVGAPQFDAFFDPRFRMEREEFCCSQGLRPDLPIIVYALGSPNFLKEHHAAVEVARRVTRGDLGNVQMLVRPHPNKDGEFLKALFKEFEPRVILQETFRSGPSEWARSQSESDIRDWVNTFRHADVVVNLASTVTVDAAIFDRPVVNVDFDSEPGRPNQALIKDVNHVWNHFKPIAESGGVWLVNDVDEIVQAVATYLRQPELHREKRRWIAEYVCGYLDGQCGARTGDAVLDFMTRRGIQTGRQRDQVGAGRG